MGKIVFCISPARCGSTALIRWFEKLGFSIYHEPSIKPFNYACNDNFTEEWYDSGKGFNTFNDITHSILEESKTRDVFIKDMIFSVYYWFLVNERNHDPYLNVLLNKCIFLFLIRDPHDSIKSLSMKEPSWNDILDNCTDYNQMVKLYKYVSKPNIIISEELYGSKESREKVLSRICDLINIKFDSKTLIWDAKSSDFDGQEWREAKKPELFKHWHGDAIKSQGFRIMPKRKEDHDMHNYDTNQSWQKQVKGAMPIYEFFLSENGKSKSQYMEK